MINDTPPTQNAGLIQEWTTLQTTFDRYERGGLTLKLVAVVLAALGLLASFAPVLICFLLAVLWLQEGIWRTFQERIGARILKIERGLRQAVPTPAVGESDAVNEAPVAFQLHSEWLATRPGALQLQVSYVANSLRPTVAYPYAVLVLAIVLWVFLQGFE